MLCEQLTLQPGHSVDSEARIYVCGPKDRTIESVQGSLRGPQCEFARTLAAEHPVQRLSGQPEQEHMAQVLITDPCYWTPQLPFRYELNLELQEAGGKIKTKTHQIGLRRWGTNGKHLWLESKRTVLRGAGVDLAHFEETDAVRQDQTALLVSIPPNGLCDMANRLGLPLVIDMCHSGASLDADLRRLTWNPAALIALLRPEQMQSTYQSSMLLAQCIAASTTKSEATSVECDLYALELNPGELPPLWLATCQKPVLAIRRGTSYSDLLAGRMYSDRLQRELAPQFDFSGYFVAT